MKLNFKAIIVGYLVAEFLNLFLNILLVCLPGGLVTGYLVADDYSDGVINGSISGAIAGIVYMLFIIFFESGMPILDISTILIVIICILFGGLGAVAGVFIRKLIKRIRTKKSESEPIKKGDGYLICDKCGGYYELKPGESPSDFVECECGGELKYSDEI